MGFDIGALVEELAGKNLRDYERRSRAVVGVLAGAAGLNEEAEAERFSQIMEQLRAGSSGQSGQESLGTLQSAVVEQMPKFGYGDADLLNYLSKSTDNNRR